MDFTRLAQASGEVQLRPAEHDRSVIELIAAGTPLGRCRIEVRDGSVVRLHWELDGSVNPLAQAMRLLIQTLYAEHQITRVEVVTDSEDRRETQVAMRTGLRREGILRGGLSRSGRLRDGAIFASVAGDPTPESPGGYTYMLDSVMPVKRLIAHVVMTDPAGRILLCRTTFKKDWELPGGFVEPGESPMLAASREVSEEIGMDLRVGRLLAMDWLPPYLGWSDAIELLYDGGEHPEDLPERLEYDVREIVHAAWFDVNAIGGVVSELNARRLPLLIPRKPDRTLHLEAGELAE